MQEASTVSRRAWWQKPSIHTEEEQNRHRKVTWLELFYDLVFVVVIAEVSHYLAGHMTYGGVAGFIILFLPAWWAWIGGTFYSERFDTDGMDSRVFAFLQMLAVAAMALFVHGALGETGAQFALAFAAVRLIHLFLWARAGYHIPQARPLTNRYLAGFSISIAIVIASVFVQPQLRPIFWLTALLIDFLTPVLSQQQQRILPRFSSTRLPERFGLFVIIVLGETIVGAVQGLSANHHLTWTIGIVGVLGMALAFGLWWVYFDFVARRAPKPSFNVTAVWSYGHLPLVMSLTAVGAGTLVLVGDLEGGEIAKRVIATAAGIALITTGVLEMTLRRDDYEPTHPLLSPTLKLVSGLVAIAIGVFSAAMSDPLLLLLIFGVVLTQMAYGSYVWFTQDMPLTEEIE